jgi:hypothetical protein
MGSADFMKSAWDLAGMVIVRIQLTTPEMLFRDMIQITEVRPRSVIMLALKYMEMIVLVLIRETDAWYTVMKVTLKIMKSLPQEIATSMGVCLDATIGKEAYATPCQAQAAMCVRPARLPRPVVVPVQSVVRTTCFPLLVRKAAQPVSLAATLQVDRRAHAARAVHVRQAIAVMAAPI